MLGLWSELTPTRWQLKEENIVFGSGQTGLFYLKPTYPETSFTLINPNPPQTCPLGFGLKNENPPGRAFLPSRCLCYMCRKVHINVTFVHTRYLLAKPSLFICIGNFILEPFHPTHGFACDAGQWASQVYFRSNQEAMPTTLAHLRMFFRCETN